ncbi:MAG: hypothetical protein J5850_04670 [Clostridia bacterium]|nr:hypothetical protein [Clostridia bacterium]
MKNTVKKTVSALLVCIMLFSILCAPFYSNASKTTTTTVKMTDALREVMSQATSFILVRHKQLGNSHYAYTDSESDHSSMGYNEYSYYGGSMLCLVTLEDRGDGNVDVKETVLKKSDGIIRDPDVSSDGCRFVFSWKQNENDDFHIYEYDLTNDSITQLTFGIGIADVEPVYTANGSIIFNSTRDVQKVDCWYTPVMNLYLMDYDGSNITRIGYDQVHTTYPTTTDDGRIIYTRWDYNDRNQMYVQALFQMFQDGTNQTELFGNNVNNPTTLLHTRQIPGSSEKYVTIISGHHMNQVGKIAVIDVSKGRNDVGSVKYIKPDAQTKELSNSGTQNVDNSLFQQGTVYKYPYAYSDNAFTCAMSKSYDGGDKRNADFDIVVMDGNGTTTTLIKSQSGYPASQFVPVKERNIFNRQSILNYANSTATYYMANVYLGQGMEGVKQGEAKYLRVVALNFRTYAIGATIGRGTGSSDPYSPISTGNGAWDVKQVLGIVEICDDGSALFSIPAGVPVYFQVLNKNGDLIQTTRSWTTAQNGEYFSCVGCHLDKNSAPPTSLQPSQAMKKGVQAIQPDKWMSLVDEYSDFDPYTGNLIGFDYLNVVQPIFNESCIQCHSDTDESFNKIKISSLNNSTSEKARADVIFDKNAIWQYTLSDPGANWNQESFDSSSWKSGNAPFGSSATDINSVWNSGETLWLRKEVRMNQYDFDTATVSFDVSCSSDITVYVNGIEVFSDSGSSSSYKKVTFNSTMKSAFKLGNNVIAVKVGASDSKSYFGLAMNAVSSPEGSEIGKVDYFNTGSTWKYYVSSSDTLGTSGSWTELGYNDSSWKTHAAPLGNRAGGSGSEWNDSNPYIWARKTFTVDSLKDVSISLSAYIFFDDDFRVYINGHQVFSDGNWNDKYTVYEFENAGRYLVEGVNVIAVRLHQHSGGYEFDMSLSGVISDGVSLSSDAVFSLEDYGIYSTRMQKYFPLSYLVLTSSTPQGGGVEWVATTSGNTGTGYTRFISSMSQCEILKPYTGGSSKSSIITKLRSGHGNLSEEQIAAISCWIDLAVPCFGSYDPENMKEWNTENQRAAAEETKKSEFYDMLDHTAKLKRSGLAPDGEISISYGGNTVSGIGSVSLIATKRFTVKSTVTVNLPIGENYLGLSLCSRIGEAIIYCPDGTFTFTVPTGSVFPSMFSDFTDNEITARVVPQSELGLDRNVALNPYDLPSAKGSFPHVTSSILYNSDLINAGRNAIDGFTANRNAGGYPNQALVLKNSIKTDDYIKIDFGRMMDINELIIRMRNAGGDTHIVSCVAEFSDGTTLDISLIKTPENQHVDLGNVRTSYVILKNIVLADAGKNVAVSEIMVMGHDVIE